MEHYAAQAGLELSIVSNRETGTTVRAAHAGSPEDQLCRSTLFLSMITSWCATA